MTMEHVITFVLVGIVGFAILMYVLLDGFDLGIGILYPWVRDEKDKHTMLNSIIPVWDGNETWLVLGGATLYGAFPIVYSTILPTLYIPIILMLLALIFRGVSFEFIHNANKSKFLWTFSFALGSTLAAFCQGVALGTFVQGYTYQNGILISESHYQWLTPFSITCGLAVIFGYALLGATWLIHKTEGNLQESMYHNAKILMVFIAIFMMAVLLWTPVIDPHITSKWYSWPNMLYLSPLPILTAFAYMKLWQALGKKREVAPFLFTMLLFLLPYIGFIISVWPYIIPHSLTLWDAAAPLNAQLFILVGLVILLPVLVSYTAYSYMVFRGKVTAGGDTQY